MCQENKYLPLLIILMFLSNSAFAQANDLTTRLSKIKSMQADFKQDVYSEKKKLLESYAGTMEFKKPNSFRWYVAFPEESLLVTDGKKLWNYDSILEQVVISKYNPNSEITPLSFVLDDPSKLKTNFDVAALANSCYKLTPKQENTNFVYVTVCFNQELIKSVTIHDHLDQNAVIEFSNIKTNQAIADQRFIFKPVPGIEVVED